MAVARQFVSAPLSVGGAMQRGYKLTCAACQYTGHKHVGTLRLGGSDKAIESRHIAQRFERDGWIVGKNDSGDRCPNCVAAEAAARNNKVRAEEKPAMATVANLPEKAPPAPKAELPRQATPDDRQVIYAKLQDCYAGKGKGYLQQWTDKRVAEDLGVPSAWVAEVREMFFGSERGNEHVEITREQAAATIKEIESLRTLWKSLHAEATEHAKKLTQVELRLGQLSTLVPNLETSLRNIEHALRK